MVNSTSVFSRNSTKKYLQENTVELVKVFNEEILRYKQTSGSNLNPSTLLPMSNVMSLELVNKILNYLNTFIIHNQPSYPRYLLNDFLKLLKYRRQIVHITNILSFSYAKQTDCLPIDFYYLPVYWKNQTDYIPEANRVEAVEISSSQVKIDPLIIDQGGLAISFWIYENYMSLLKPGTDFIEVFNGLIDNSIKLTYLFTKTNLEEILRFDYNTINAGNSNLQDISNSTFTNYITHQFKFMPGINNTNFNIYAKSRCAEYVFVLLSLEKDCDNYKLIVSMRFTASNSRAFFNKTLTNSEVEKLVLYFNRADLVSRINMYKNFHYSENEELKVMYQSFDQEQDGGASITAGNNINFPIEIKECKVDPTCAYSVAGNGATQCSICEKGYVNKGGRCVKVCPDGTYQKKKLGNIVSECLPCSSNCEKCKSSKNCQICKGKDLKLFNGKCIVTCPENTVSKEKIITVNSTSSDGLSSNSTQKIQTCEICDKNCLLCSANPQEGCITCKGHFYSHKGECVTSCPDGFYKDDLRKSCVPCDSKCKICESKVNNEGEKCLFCKAPFYLWNGKCIDNCGKGYFMNNSTLTCEQCTTNCLDCNVNPTNCEKCMEGYILTNNTGSNKQHCKNICPDGNVQVNGVCLPCADSHCVDCQKGDLKICRQCDNSTILQEGQCKFNCTSGYFFNTKTNQCEVCNSFCGICTDTTKCLQCKSPKILLEDNSCVDECPEGYVRFGSVCVRCQNTKDCKQCSPLNTQICVDCYKPLVLFEGVCMPTCPEKYFASQNSICSPCVDGCKQCDNSNSCKICDEGYYMKNGQCVKDCKDSYVLKNNECVKCHDTDCIKCYENNPNNCITCRPGTFLYGLKCVETCPAETYPSLNNICEPCKKDCASCTSQYDCKSCKGDKVLQGYDCKDECDEGYTSLMKSSPICKKCTDSNCKKCSGKANYCEECKKPNVLLEGECVTSCPDGFFLDSFLNKCIKCDPICGKCSLSSSNCISCITGFTYSSNNSTCSDTCLDSQVTDLSQPNLCKNCTASFCKKCKPDSLNECIICQDGFKLDTLNKTCVKICPDGTFLSTDGKTCETCQNCLTCKDYTGECTSCKEPEKLILNECIIPSHDREIPKIICKDTNCKKCDKLQKNTCFLCNDPYALLDGKCLPLCAQGYFLDSITNTCQICKIDNCAKCSSQDSGASCSQCKDQFFQVLTEGQCKIDCPEGYYKNLVTQTCEKCEVSDCKTCSDSKTVCTNCKEGFYFIPSENRCAKDCPVGFYTNTITMKCEPCSSNCHICSSEAQCQKCDTLNFLYEGRCVPDCPTNFYKNSESRSCNKCEDENCLKCLTKDKCVSCKPPLILSGNICVSSCSNKTYTNTLTNECKDCPQYCEKCESSEKCITCEKNKVLQSNGKCEDICPDNKVYVNNTCIECQSIEPFCRKCDSNDLSKCNECQYPKVLFNNICIDLCPPDYYEENRQCFKCLTGCKSCKSSKECFECHEKLYLYNGKCVTDCVTGMYNQNGICKPCTQNCLDCNSEKDCNKCDKGLVDSYGQCKSECDPGTYFDIGLNKCLPCSTYCLNCKDKDNCIECRPPTINNKGQCKKNCEEGFVEINGKCEICPSGCLECKSDSYFTNPGKNCIKCSEKKVLYQGECIEECPTGNGYYFYNGTTVKFVNGSPEKVFEGNVCKKCSSTCSECRDTSSNCINCHPPYILLNSTCISDCPASYTKVDKKCESCQVKDCEKCEVNNPSNCISCKSPLLLINNTCTSITTCPSGSFIDPVTRNCVNCELNCKTCDSTDTCTECKSGYQLSFIPTENKYKCVSPCGSGKTLNKDNSCTTCTSTYCDQCQVYDPSTCQVCQKGYNLLITGQYKNETKCINVCPKSYYQEDKTCKECPTNCEECENKSTCKVCNKGYILLDGKCVDRCPDKFTERNSKCVPCTDSNCLDCDNVDTRQCKSCGNSFYLKEDTKECVPICPKGYFIKGLNSKICSRCTDNCENCSNSKICEKCVSPYKLKDGNCVKECGDGYTADSTDLQCKYCVDENCKKCDSNNPASCIECKDPFLNFNSKCLPNCPEGYYKNAEGICIKCAEDDCINCNNPLTGCKECKPPKINFLGKCVIVCPDGTVNINNKCTYCTTDNCSECNTTNENQCKVCNTGYFLTVVDNKTKCVKKCPKGTYMDTASYPPSCKSCEDSLCKVCRSKNECKVCKNNFQLQVKNNTIFCIDNCEDGYVNKTIISNYTINNTTVTQEVNKCVSCETGNIFKCFKCDPNNLNRCIKCKDGYLLYNNTCYKPSECPTGTYPIGDKCSNCNERCKTCESSAFDCTSCKESYFYNKKTKSCVETCQDGYVNVKNACVKCDTDDKLCKTCYEKDLSKCKTCKGSLAIYKDSCIDVCPSGSYYDSVTNTCGECTRNCKNCKKNPLVMNSSDKNTICEECNNGFYLSNGDCVSDCQEGYFKNYTTCSTCSPNNCATCLSTGGCTSCKTDPTTKIPKILYQGECIDICPSGTFKENNTCIPCSYDCLKCSSNTKCEVCKPPLELTIDGKCGYPLCGTGYTQRDGMCYACTDSKCRVCDPIKLNMCKECKPSFYLLDSKCVPVCPEGYFNSTDNTCVQCKGNCGKCTNNSDCQTCLNGFYKMNGECVICDSNTHVIIGDKCETCSVPFCDKCQTGKSNQCEVCRPDKNLIYVNNTYTCIDQCPEGTFRNETTHSCQPCNSDCLLCTHSQCQICKDPLVNLNGKCVTDCPSGYTIYPDPATGAKKCRKCRDEHCLICDGSKPEVCYKCDDKYILYKEECKIVCPKGFVLNGTNCIACTDKCDVCDLVTYSIHDPFKNFTQIINAAPNSNYDKTYCKKCDTNYKNQEGKCKKECDIGYYEDMNGNCIKCRDHNCLTCNPSDICRKCNNSTYLDKTTDKCVFICPDGYYKNPFSNECEKCRENCKLCKDSKTCYVCAEGYNFINNTCVKICPDGYTSVNGICQPCTHPDCTKCDINHPDKCLKCNGNSYLINGICVPTCPKSTYSDKLTGKCESCKQTCETCESFNNCTLCKPGFIFTNVNNTGHCKNPCPDGQIEYNGKCTCCADHNCKICSQDLKICMKCLSGFYLYDNTCVNVCPVGYYRNKHDECKKCEEGCELCMSATQCTKCYAKFYLKNYLDIFSNKTATSCVRECDDGYFGDCNSGTCMRCHEACERCIDATNANCPRCNIKYFKSDNLCVAPNNCKFGTYADEEKRECVSCKIPHCDECKDRNTCKTCIKGYSLGKDNSTCTEFKSLVNVIKSPVIFSEPSHEKYNSYNGFSFTKNLKSSCIDSNYFTIAFWFRLVTNDLKDENTFIEIKDQNSIGAYISFKIIKDIEKKQNSLSDKRYKCVATVRNNKINKDGNVTTVNFSVTYDDCNFNNLKNWNFFTINLNKEKDMGSQGLGSNVNFIISNPMFNTTTYINGNFTEIMFTKKNVIISNATNLYINPEPYFKSNPMFEISNMNVMEYIPSNEDIRKLSKDDKPNECDYQCDECINSKCIKCSNSFNPKPDDDGFCQAAFVSISPGLVSIKDENKIVKNTVRSLLKSKYLSSPKYSFTSFFYLKSDKIGLISQSSKNPLYSIPLFSIKYQNSDSNSTKIKGYSNLINANILKDKLQVQIANVKLNYNNINNSTSFIDHTLILTNTWYSISISVTPKLFNLKLIEINFNKTMIINHEQEISIANSTIIRLTPDAIYTLGGNSNINPNNTLSQTNIEPSFYDTRLYINNVISNSDYINNLKSFACGENCESCDQLLTCQKCITGYTLNYQTNSCNLKNIGTPASIYPRRSFYNKDEESLDAPYNFINSDFSMSIWMRKNLPSAISGDQAPYITNLISLYDNSTNKYIPIVQQQIKENLTSVFIVDNQYLIAASRPDTLSRMAAADKNYFANYINRLEAEAEKQMPAMNINSTRFEYSVSYKNTTPDWISCILSSEVKLNSRRFKIDLLDNTVNKALSLDFTVPLKFNLNNSIILGDKEAMQINMIYGPNLLYSNQTHNENSIEEMRKGYPKDCDPSCLDCDYSRGYCRLCGIDKLQGDKCNMFYYGFKSSGIYDKAKYSSVKTKSVNETFNADYNTRLDNYFKKNIDSSTYACIGWFRLFSVVNTTAKGESILFRISNYDPPGIKEDDPFFNYYPGLNLITLKILYNQGKNEQTQYAFVISDFDRDVVLPVKGLKVRADEWILAYASVNVNKREFTYKIYSQVENTIYASNYTLNYYPQKLQEISTIKLFGINSVTNKNTLETCAFFYNFYLSTNMGFSPKAIEYYRDLIDPTTNKTESLCDPKCTKCLASNCFACKPGFELNNNLCTIEKISTNYLLLTDQNNANNQNSKIFFPSKVISDNYGFQFNIRRNYFNSESSLMTRDSSLTFSRVFLELGSLKLSLITSNSDANIRLEYAADPSSTIQLGPLDSNSTYDYEWYSVNLNFIGDENRIECLLFDSYESLIDKKIMNFNQVKIPYDYILINNLNYEVTVYSALFLLENSTMNKPLLPSPEIDCPIDCAFCERNNKCSLCTYGLQCDSNDSTTKLCKIRDRKLNNIEIVSDQQVKNFFALKDLFTLNKIVRFKQFSLVFSIYINEEFNYNNIFKLINNADTTLSKYSQNSITYNMITLSYKQKTKTFALSYHNRYTQLKFQQPLSMDLPPYPSTQFPSTWHYIGLSYDSYNKKINIVLFITEDNYMSIEIPILGELENLGFNTNLVFLDDFLKLNSNNSGLVWASVFNINFLYEHNKTTKELRKQITDLYSNEIDPACSYQDRYQRTCIRCKENKKLLNGVCLSENLVLQNGNTDSSNSQSQQSAYVNFPSTPVTSYTTGDINPIYFTKNNIKEITSFTLSFLYKRISYPEETLTPILNLLIYDNNNKPIKSLFEIYEVNNNLIGLCKLFNSGSNTDTGLISIMEKYTDNTGRFTWLYINIRVDIKGKLNTVHIYNYANNKQITKTFSINYRDDITVIESVRVPQDYSVGISFDMSSTLVKIPMNVFSNPPLFNIFPSKITEFKLSQLVFTPNYLNTDLELVNLRPNTPLECPCGCGCVNFICPENCRLDNLQVDLSHNPSNQGELFNPLFTNIKNALSNNFFNNDLENMGKNSQEYMQSLNFAADYHNFIVTFNFNLQAYFKANGGNTQQITKKASKKRNSGFMRQEIAFAMRETELGGSVSNSIGSMGAPSSLNLNSQSTAETNSNSDILFMLTNQYIEASTLKMNSKISQDLIDRSILTVKMVKKKIRVYLGSDRYTQYSSYVDIDFNLGNKDKLVFVLWVDLTKNQSKFILIADNKRSDKDFEYNFSAENINLKTLFYSHSMVNNLSINFSGEIDQQLFYLKPTIDSHKYKEDLCPANCKTCYKNRCLECGFKKRMHNNSCIDVSNNQDFTFRKQKKRMAKNTSTRNFINSFK
jgi:hypothetical protein